MKKDAIRKIALIAITYFTVAILLTILISLDVSALSQNASIAGLFALLKAGYLYFLGALFFLGTATCFKKAYSGILASKIGRTFDVLAAAFLFFFVFGLPFLPSAAHPLGIYAFSLMAISSVFSLFDTVLGANNQFSLQGLIRAVTLVILGLTLRFAVLNCFTTVRSEFGDVIFYGFLFAAITALFYPLKYSSRSATKKLGSWLGSGTWQKVVLGIMLAVYLLLGRPYLLGLNANGTIIGEWVFIGLIAGAAFLRLRSKIADISAPIILESWQKHQQELGFKTSEEFIILSKQVDDFLTTGEKKTVLKFLFKFLLDQKINPENVFSALDELISYHDMSNPHLFFSWDANFFEQARKESRKQVLDQTIKNLNPNLFRNEFGS